MIFTLGFVIVDFRELNFLKPLKNNIDTVEPHLSGHLRSQTDCPDK